MMAPLFKALSPRGANARLTVLIFHRVPLQADPLFPGEIDAAQFDSICAWVSRWFQVLPLDRACRDLREGRLAARALSITFDDGYADNHDVALPILRKHGLTATFFIATGFLDGGRMWNDTVVEAIRNATRLSIDGAATGVAELGALPLADLAQKRATLAKVLNAFKYLPLEERERAVRAFAAETGARLPDDLMMNSAQVQAMHRAGMTIGGHTVRHPILARLAPADALREMREGKAMLESLIQGPLHCFAYPNGRPGRDYAAEHAAMAREAGFSLAVTTAPGAASVGSDPFQLPRFTPWDRSRWAFGLRLARNLRSAPEARA